MLECDRGSASIDCFFLVGLAHAIHQSMFEEARALVEEAVAYLKANGKEKALAEFNKRDGEFVKGELYIFVYDLNGVMMAHPINHDLVGKTSSMNPIAGASSSGRK